MDRDHTIEKCSVYKSDSKKLDLIAITKSPEGLPIFYQPMLNSPLLTFNYYSDRLVSLIMFNK